MVLLFVYNKLLLLILLGTPNDFKSFSSNKTIEIYESKNLGIR